MAPPIVLCYHAISPRWEAALSTTPQRLERQLRVMLSRGYRAVRFSEAVAGQGTSRLFAVTFDDAFRSVFQHARPILARLGIPATLFVPTGPIEAGGPLGWPGIDHWLRGPDAGELAAMSWSEIARLAQEGWEIGSHTVSHPHLTLLDDAALHRELTESRAQVSARVGTDCTSIAYPYGDADDRVVAAARDAGYSSGASLRPWLTGSDRFLWPRIGVYHVDDDRRFALKVSPQVIALRRSAAWRIVERLRDR